jgi:hypothetical protein
VAEFRDAAAALPLSLDPVAPSPGARARLLSSIAAPSRRAAPLFTRFFWTAAAAALFAMVFVSLRRLPDAQEIALYGTLDAPDAKGCVRCCGRAVDFCAEGLPRLPGGKCFQLWHIGADRVPVAQGTFHPDPSGMLRGSDALKREAGPNDLFGFTMEPDGGSRQPTLPIYAVAKY